jgi:uncharacterized protein DUF4160
MPTIAFVDGIAIILFWNDHDPPHFHAEARDFKARISIHDGSLIDAKGAVRPKDLRALRTWSLLHRDVLLENWYRVRSGKLPNKIEN